MNNSNFPVYKHNSRSLLVLGLFLLMILGAANQLPTRVDDPRNVINVALSESSKAVLCSLEDSFSTIAQRVEPGVVSVTSVQSAAVKGGPGKNEEPNSLEDFFKHLFEGRFVPPNRGALPHGLHATPAASRTVTAAGSGTIVRRQGSKFYVLTNYHVVQDAFRVAVRLADDTDLKGIVVGVDPTTDLAVVEISSPKLSDKNIVPLGDSSTVKVGAWALALGSPFGFEHTLTVGVVSAVQRELDEGDNVYPDLIQTDAAINKGNSGGPLLDVEGHVIGINAAIASPTGGSVGLGFAIPVNAAKSVLDDLIAHGRVVRGWLGAGVQTLTPVLSEYYGVKHGVLVASVDPKGPAAKAGMESEDVIVAVGSTSITEIRQLQRVMAATAPGSSITVSVIRNGKSVSYPIQVGVLPSTPKGRPAPPPDSIGTGVSVRTLTGELASRIGLKGVKGVIVIDVMPGSPAEEGGLQEGDVVVSFRGQCPTCEKDFSQMMKDVKPGSVVILKVLRKSSTRIIGFRAE